MYECRNSRMNTIPKRARSEPQAKVSVEIHWLALALAYAMNTLALGAAFRAISAAITAPSKPRISLQSAGVKNRFVSSHRQMRRRKRAAWTMVPRAVWDRSICEASPLRASYICFDFQRTMGLTGLPMLSRAVHGMIDAFTKVCPAVSPVNCNRI
ncbi:hypothetical protein B0H14DRAFT_56384 [Mycena olivaceomarginata]|nr:hypothetical protein B0H14DRAFT_56384 [Mycena olivaceomarginata]